MARLGFLGTGRMGSAMAANLLRAGHEVAVYNRTADRARPLVEAGARLAASPAAAAEGAAAVFSMLTDDTASRAVWTGPEGALVGAAPGTLCLECSSVSRDWVLQLAATCAAGAMRFLDCPVAGRPDAATQGALAVFAGGAAGDLAAARPFLDAIGKTVTHFGPAGCGIAFKLIYNALGAVQIAALAEAMQACEAAGMDLDACAAAFGEGATGSPHVVRHGAAMARKDGPQQVAFPGASRLKDLGYGIALVEAAGGSARLAWAAQVVFGIMAEEGMAERNDSEVIDALRRRHGGAG